MPIFIAIASWNIPQVYRDRFPDQGTILKRYSQIFNSVEINSSFYRNHKRETYIRWKNTVPENFKFITKFPKLITHTNKLKITNPLEVASVIEGMEGLRDKWGGLLVQLPPKLEFNLETSELFFNTLRQYYNKPLFLEPRHLSWTSVEARALIKKYRISKVLADPERCLVTQKLNADQVYYRLHGSPELYKSSYSDSFIEYIAKEAFKLSTKNKTVWVVFDNTQFGFATENALKLKKSLNQVSLDSSLLSGEVIFPELQ